jgi:hypothetical protein
MSHRAVGYTQRSQTLCIHQRPRDWIVHLLTTKYDWPGERCCMLLAREQHFLAGSFMLWALTWPSTWEPADLDFFAMANSKPYGDRKVALQDTQHYTPFLHDLFEFKRPFYTDTEVEENPSGLVQHAWMSIQDWLISDTTIRNTPWHYGNVSWIV